MSSGSRCGVGGEAHGRYRMIPARMSVRAGCTLCIVRSSRVIFRHHTCDTCAGKLLPFRARAARSRVVDAARKLFLPLIHLIGCRGVSAWGLAHSAGAHHASIDDALGRSHKSSPRAGARGVFARRRRRARDGRACPLLGPRRPDRRRGASLGGRRGRRRDARVPRLRLRRRGRRRPRRRQGPLAGARRGARARAHDVHPLRGRLARSAPALRDHRE